MRAFLDHVRTLRPRGIVSADAAPSPSCRARHHGRIACCSYNGVSGDDRRCAYRCRNRGRRYLPEGRPLLKGTNDRTDEPTNPAENPANVEPATRALGAARGEEPLVVVHASTSKTARVYRSEVRTEWVTWKDLIERNPVHVIASFAQPESWR